MIPAQAMQNNVAVQKVVLSGMKLLYSPSTRKMLMDGISADAPMPQKLAMEIAGVMKLIDDRTPAGIPPQAIAPGAIMLLFDLAAFMRQAKIGNPSDEDVMAAIKVMKGLLLELFTKHGKGATAQQQAQPAPAGQQPPAQQPPAQPAGLLAPQGA